MGHSSVQGSSASLLEPIATSWRVYPPLWRGIPSPRPATVGGMDGANVSESWSESRSFWLPGAPALASEPDADSEPVDRVAGVGRRRSQATELVELAGDVELFRTSRGDVYAYVQVDDHRDRGRWVHAHFAAGSRNASSRPAAVPQTLRRSRTRSRCLRGVPCSRALSGRCSPA
jgi:hypothetical protein